MTTGIQIKEIQKKTAKDFWDDLSPESSRFNNSCEIIYRGQRDASWSLEPSLLRNEYKPVSRCCGNNESTPPDQQIFYEFRILQEFVAHCDSASISLPGDSPDFRKKYLDLDSNKALAKYIFSPNLWPNPELYQLMAIAQHHGLPTRLLDWSRRSYVAAYFAASSALQVLNLNARETGQVGSEKKLAVWVLNIESKNLLLDLDVVSVPSGQNRNIASQAGCFTVLRQRAAKGKLLEGVHLLDKYIEEQPQPESFLLKVTVPVTEAVGILDLCKKYGVTAATIYPDTYGAAKAAMDEVNVWEYTERKGVG
ncbi:hypothetical protein MNBD_GAMMA18-207 [hydrothermal vent metagenome]|uniref:FRG domain-containing protein n=1 Tax=hydrothermal vent metagenome TaxID=652676 RepID=A0A3B0ZSE1_9ZZZZ